MTEPVAITGAGAVTPLGVAPALWARYRAGERRAGGAPDLALEGLPEAVRTRALRAERVTQLALAAGGAALAAAGLAATEGPPRPQVGVVLGTAFGCFLTNAAYEERLVAGGPPGASPRLFAATVSNAAAGELGIAYRLGGPAVTLSAGGASGLAALGHACDSLRAGRAEALVAGGMDALGDVLARWIAAGGLTPGRPAAEAAALVVLEPGDRARARGVATLGWVAGHAIAFEPEPASAGAGEGLAAAVTAALDEASVRAADLDVVVTGAPPALAGLERRALAHALAPAQARTVAPKDVLGETFGAAGPLALLAALAEAPPGAAVLVLDVCPTGHTAALVARRAGEP
jgi:3-oxoacyl-[acyl-carrier-protein] synthase II